MRFSNPIHKSIYDLVVKPSMETKRDSTVGWVFEVDEEKGMAIVATSNARDGFELKYEDVPIPVNGDGVFRQSLSFGDQVTLSFYNGNKDTPFISMINRKGVTPVFESKFGTLLPRGINYL